MNFFPAELLKFFWIGFGILCLLVAVVSLLRIARARLFTARWTLILVVGGGVLFILSLLANFGPAERAPLDWIFSATEETALRIAASADYLSGWFLGLTVLLLSPRALRKDAHPYLPSGAALAMAGVLLSWTSESVWTAILGWTFLAGSGLLIRVGLMAVHPTAAAPLGSDILRSGIFILLLWVSALGLETFGFRWDFERLPGNGEATELFLGSFFFALSSLALPWTNLSTSIRPEEEGETESMLFSGILLPASIAGALYRWTAHLDTSLWSTLAGLWVVVIGLLFFMLYVAAKSRPERLRILTVLYGSLALSSALLFPSWGSILFSIGLAAVVGMLVIDFKGVPAAGRKIILLFGFAAVAGVPGFLPGPFLRRIWLELGVSPLECGGILLLHALFLLAAAREVGVRLSSTERAEGESTDLTKVIPYALLLLFILAPWTTGTWTGGLLEPGLDQIPLLQGLPWVNDFGSWLLSNDAGGIFFEGQWVQLAVTFIAMLLLIAFRGGRDPFLTREETWSGLRSVASKDLGLSWIGSRLVQGLGFIGHFVDTRVLAPVWDRFLPAVGREIGSARFVVSRKVEAFTEMFTGDRWNIVVSAPSYLIQAMTNGRSSWYLFFTISVTFLLVLHFTMKFS